MWKISMPIPLKAMDVPSKGEALIHRIECNFGLPEYLIVHQGRL